MGWLIDLMDAISDSDIDTFSSTIKNLRLEEKKKLSEEKVLDQLWLKAVLVYNRINRNNEYVKVYKPPSEQELALNRTFPDAPVPIDITPISEILSLLIKMGTVTSITHENYSRQGVSDSTIKQLNNFLSVSKHIKDKALDEAVKNIYELRTSQNSDLGPAEKKGGKLRIMKRGGAGDIFQASMKGDLARVKELVEAGADLNAKSSTGNTALALASQSGHMDIAKYLVEKGANVNAKDPWGYTVIIFASQSRDLDIVKYLVEKGADVNAKENDGYTSLMLAAGRNSLDIVKYLVEKGANVNAKNYAKTTALMFSSKIGYLDIVKYLIEKGADVNVKDEDGKTACDLSKTPEIKALLCPPPVPTEERNIPSGSETEITYEEIKNGDVLVDFNKEYVHKRYYDPETVSKLKSNPHTREPIGKKTVYTAKIVAGGSRKTRKQKRKSKKTRKHKQ